MNILHHLPVVACVLVLATSAAEAQIYTWKDGNGVVHLSDRRPGNEAVVTPAPRLTPVTPNRAPTKTLYTPPKAAPSSRPPLPKVQPAAFVSARPIETKFYNIYDKFIERYARQYYVNADLVRAVIQVESAFNPFARSTEGAVGLMQLMPDTAVEMGVKNRLDPEDNIRGGVAYLRQLLNRYGDDVTLALAAYNAGPGAVDRHGNTVPPYAETKQYVANVKQRSGDAGASRPEPPARASLVVYKTMEIRDGQPVTHYSNTKPTTGPYQIISR